MLPEPASPQQDPRAPSWPAVAAWPPVPGVRPEPPAPVALPYHRLGRVGPHRWWRPLLGSLLVLVFALAGFLALVLLVLLVATLAGLPTEQGFPTGALPQLVGDLAGIAVLLPAVLLAARLAQRRPAGTLSSVSGRLRWRWQLVCAGVAVPAVAVALGLTLLLSLGAEPLPGEGQGSWVGWSVFLPALAALALLVPLQAAAEEYLFRGWLVQAFGAYLRTPWPGIAVSAALFSAAHGYGQVWGALDLVVFGLVMGWLTVRTGGLEAAIGLHAVNNLVGFVAAAAVGQLDLETTAADAPWQLLAADLVALPAYAAVLLLLARRRGLPVRSPGLAEPSG